MVIEAKTSTDEQPLPYDSFNTFELAETVPYAIDNEQSRDFLQEIYDSFANYIPKAVDTFVQRRVNLTSNL